MLVILHVCHVIVICRSEAHQNFLPLSGCINIRKNTGDSEAEHSTTIQVLGSFMLHKNCCRIEEGAKQFSSVASADTQKAGSDRCDERNLDTAVLR